MYTVPMTAAARLLHHEGPVPPLANGDRLASEEFERRYRAMPGLKKAELIEGVVYMPSPVRFEDHAEPHALVLTWLGLYASQHPEVQFGDNATVRLDEDNDLQPDAVLRYRQGSSSISADGYIEGPPELLVEVAASSVSIDLHHKKNAYRRNRVREYLCWRVHDGAVDWFALQNGDYLPLQPGADGILESRVFPGLRLAAPALLARDLAAVLRAQLGG